MCERANYKGNGLWEVDRHAKESGQLELHPENTRSQRLVTIGRRWGNWRIPSHRGDSVGLDDLQKGL